MKEIKSINLKKKKKWAKNTWNYFWTDTEAKAACSETFEYKFYSTLGQKMCAVSSDLVNI